MKPIIDAINASQRPLILQAENPDGDSLASALALEAILGDLGKSPSMFCSVAIPKYLRYLPGWDRVNDVLPTDFDLSIVVDASSSSLFERAFNEHLPEFKKHQFIVIDHHSDKVDLPLETLNLIDDSAVSTGQVVAQLSKNADWPLSAGAADMIASSILSDSLGLTSPKTTAVSIRLLADMVEAGADLSRLDEARRELNKKTDDIFRYKGRLFERVELLLDGRLAIVTIPWEEIEAYSDAYNPSMLIIDEMRQIEGVAVAAAFKTYPDGKITVKLRANPEARFMDRLAEHFGGGGHPFAAGFKLHDMPLDTLKKEFTVQVKQLLEQAE